MRIGLLLERLQVTHHFLYLGRALNMPQINCQLIKKYKEEFIAVLLERVIEWLIPFAQKHLEPLDLFFIRLDAYLGYLLPNRIKGVEQSSHLLFALNDGWV
jgi:hypothetical protein